MKWIKKGLIFQPSGNHTWSKSHASIPTPVLYDDTIRVYYGSRDANGVSRIGFVDICAENPKRIINYSKEPVVNIGDPGTFDDNGVIPTCILSLDKKTKLLYYVGFEVCKKIPYRLLSGLAISEDNGNSFVKYDGPILERSKMESFFRCAPFVIKDKNIFKLWYIAGNSWWNSNGKLLPVYKIHYLESKNGYSWKKEGNECISITESDVHGYGRPYVIKKKQHYFMFYSIRKKNVGYRLGYAESSNGITWERKDHSLGMDVSAKGWDSKEICYSSVINYKNKVYMFYNGNNFGESGFGYAVLNKEQL